MKDFRRPLKSSSMLGPFRALSFSRTRRLERTSHVGCVGEVRNVCRMCRVLSNIRKCANSHLLYRHRRPVQKCITDKSSVSSRHRQSVYDKCLLDVCVKVINTSVTYSWMLTH
jgi:hypothetical protein